MSTLGAIPTTYIQQTSSSRNFFVQKGQLNQFMMRPKIVNEHAEASPDIVATVQSGNAVGQVFIASQDNINGIELTMRSAGGEVFDDFETYANSAALQAEWLETDVGDPATLETIIIPPGSDTKSMKLPGDATVGDEWVRTITATDYTGYTSRTSIHQDSDYSVLKMRFFIGDGANTKSQLLVVQNANEWEDIFIDIDLMSEDGGGTTDVTSITQIGFRLDDIRNGSSVYIDDILFAPKAGSVLVELWDFGPEPPVSGVTSLDDGTQYEDIGDIGISDGSVMSDVIVELSGGLRKYHIDGFIAGVASEEPGNITLNIGNFYGIVIKHVDTDVVMYGALDNTFSRPIRGGAFTTVDNSTPAVEIGEFTDLHFVIYSTQDCYLNTLVKSYNATPGSRATEVTYIESSDHTLQGIIAGEHKPGPAIFAEFKDRTFRIPKGGIFKVDLNDDFEDDVSQITLLIGYIYEPPKTFSKAEL